MTVETATAQAVRNSHDRLMADQGTHIAQFMRRFMPRQRDEAFDFEREFHYLLQRQTEIAQAPWQDVFANALRAAPLPPIFIPKES